MLARTQFMMRDGGLSTDFEEIVGKDEAVECLKKSIADALSEYLDFSIEDCDEYLSAHFGEDYFSVTTDAMYYTTIKDGYAKIAFVDDDDEIQWDLIEI